MAGDLRGCSQLLTKITDNSVVLLQQNNFHVLFGGETVLSFGCSLTRIFSFHSDLISCHKSCSSCRPFQSKRMSCEDENKEIQETEENVNKLGIRLSRCKMQGKETKYTTGKKGFQEQQ